MAETTQQVNLELRAIDNASAIVGKIGRVVGKLGGSLDNITRKTAGIVSRFGGIGTALSLGASVASAKRYYDQIDRIKNVAGGTANEIAGIRYAMIQSGVSAQDMEKAYVTLAKKGGEMNAHMKGAQKLSKRMGVDFRKGPLESMIKLADQVKSGKVGYKELNNLLGETGLRMRDFLKQGGPIVAKAIEEARKKMGHVNDETLMQYMEMQQEVGKVKQAWQRMVVIVGAKLMPVLTKMMEGIAGRIDSWADGAARFGQFLVDHMEAVVSAAKLFGKIMAANYVLMKLTGEGLGGNMGKLVDRARKSRPGGGKFALAEGVMAGGIRGRAAGGIMSMLGKGGKSARIGRILAKFFGGVMQLIPIVKLLAKLGVVAAIVALVVNGIRDALASSKELTARVGSAMKKFMDALKNVGGAIAKIFGPGSILGGFFKFIGGKLVQAFSWLLEAMTKFLNMVKFFVDWMREWSKDKLHPIKAAERAARQPEYDAWHSRNKSFTKAEKLAEKLTQHQGKVTNESRRTFKEFKIAAEKSGRNVESWIKWKKLGRFDTPMDAAPGERPQFTQDFRGSIFEITQQFAEGFDPDRIAAAFATDLSMFGERKMEAGTSPLGVIK